MIEKIIQKFKHDYRHYICLFLTIIFLLFTVFYFKYAFPRLIESFIDLGTSAKFYVNELFELDMSCDITINNFTKQPFEMPFNLPNTWEEFKVLWNDYWQLFITKENFIGYFSWLGNIIYYLSKILIMIMPIFIMLILLLNRDISQNNNYNKDSKALIWWKNKFEKKFYLPINALESLL